MLFGASAGAEEQAARVDREVHFHPRFTKRCRALDLASVGGDWATFEAQIIKWIGTCVTSRTGNARREVSLVRASKTIAPLWRSLAKGKPARVVPSYTWGSFRVERIEFSSPQATGAGSQTQRPSPGSTPGGVPRPPTGHATRVGGATPSPGQQPAPGPEQKPTGFQPPASVPDIDPRLPDEGDDLLFDARRLVEKLRADGQHQDADRLERKIKTAGKVLVSLALLAGTYYVGTKVRAGKLLFLWGWNATGGDYMRRAARLQQLVPEVESALRDVISAAKPHVPPAGSGIDWKVLDQLVDGTLPAQLDDAACGPACVQMALLDRGIEIAQDELIRRARATIHPELKSRRVGGAALVKLLRDLDPDGGWTYLSPFGSSLLDNKTPREIIETLGRSGSWIAQVGAHFVVVDGFDRVGYLRVRDPWYEPGIVRGIRAGNHYRVSMKTFFENWYGVAVYRK